MEKKPRSESHRKADKKYNEVHKPIYMAISYKTDKIEGLRLKSYLNASGISVNSYIKNLIKNDLDLKNIPYPDNPEEEEE